MSPTVRDNLDEQLLSRFQQSWERQEEARLLLPPKWLADTRPAAQQLNELFLELLSNARARVAAERDALASPAAVAELRD